MAGGPAFYSDAKILGEGGREQQEATTGVWLYEIGDLHGMKRAEVESVKVFASRTVDRARPAYGRFRVDQPRRCVFVATTNDDAYLKSETGNRRFWPVKTGHVDLAGLRRDRDQLWAEAAEMEARGASAILEEALWDAARTEQDERMEDDPWTDLIRRYVDDERVKRDDVTVHEVLADNQHIAALPATLTTGILMRGGHCLRRLGWFKYRVRLPKGGYQWRYKRLQ
jgi:predicted P-loop ATPase